MRKPRTPREESALRRAERKFPTTFTENGKVWQFWSLAPKTGRSEEAWYVNSEGDFHRFTFAASRLIRI